MHISFLLPEDNRSGGVRVTSLMAQHLKMRGHEVRVICIKRHGFLARLKKAFRKFSSKSLHDGWLYQFHGPVICSSEPERLEYRRGEIVVAVGSYTIDTLMSLPDVVCKLKYNHGLPAVFDADAKRVWSYPLPTITVSATLVPLLEDLAPNSVLGVVPNGIDGMQYFDMGLERNGIGLFFSPHSNKAPDFAIDIVQEFHRRHPHIPIHLISTQSCPEELLFARYHHLPSVGEVREIYNSCRVWLLPSDTEGLPGPVLEAMSCGTAVVSTDNDGSLEIITPEINGLISPRRDLDAFINNIERAYFDRAKWTSLSCAGKQRARDFSWDAAVEMMEAILIRVSRRCEETA